MGYGGYLNPFTNEAQVNGITPKFRLPTVSGHEVGHQLGYLPKAPPILSAIWSPHKAKTPILNIRLTIMLWDIALQTFL